MCVTVKFAHFNQRYARIRQNKNSALRAFRYVEDQFDSLVSIHHPEENPREALHRVLMGMVRK